MSDILTRIETYKRAEIAAAKRARPPAAVEADARAAPPPRGILAALERRPAARGRRGRRAGGAAPARLPRRARTAPCRRRRCADRRDQEGEPIEGPDPRR